jgi:hypothetical protein
MLPDTGSLIALPAQSPHEKAVLAAALSDRLH